MLNYKRALKKKYSFSDSKPHIESLCNRSVYFSVATNEHSRRNKIINADIFNNICLINYSISDCWRKKIFCWIILSNRLYIAELQFRNRVYKKMAGNYFPFQMLFVWLPSVRELYKYGK